MTVQHCYGMIVEYRATHFLLIEPEWSLKRYELQLELTAIQLGSEA